MEKLKSKLIELGIFEDLNVNEKDIADLEEKLNIKVHSSVRDYLLTIGLFSYEDKDFYGLGVDGYENTLESTLKQRELFKDFPKDSLILADIGVDGLLLLVNTKGEVLEWTPSGHNKIVSDNLEYFLLSEIE